MVDKNEPNVSGHLFTGLLLVFFLVNGVLGIMLNFLSALKLLTSFNLKMAPYLVLFLGNCVNVLCLTIGTTCLAIIWITPEFNSSIICYFIIVPAILAYTFGSATLCLISLFRHQIVVSTNATIVNEKQVLHAYYAMAAFVIYIVIFLGITITFDVPSLVMLESCVRGSQARPTSPLLAMIGLLNAVTILLPVIYDIKTYRLISKRTLPLAPTEEGNGDIAGGQEQMLSLPFKATLLSTGMALSYILLTAISTQLSQLKGVQDYLLSVISSLLVSFRHPLVASILFKSNAVNVARNEEQARESKRQVEIAYAMEKRRIKRAFTLEPIAETPKIMADLNQDTKIS